MMLSAVGKISISLPSFPPLLAWVMMWMLRTPLRKLALDVRARGLAALPSRGSNLGNRACGTRPVSRPRGSRRRGWVETVSRDDKDYGARRAHSWPDRGSKFGRKAGFVSITYSIPVEKILSFSICHFFVSFYLIRISSHRLGIVLQLVTQWGRSVCHSFLLSAYSHLRTQFKSQTLE